nr:uncharacterized protein LOC109165411 [Ipomoea batatas]
MEESKYVYLLHQRGLFRVNVSSFDEHEELKIECVFYYDQTKKFCTDMALFSHRRNLFMIGGDSAETTTFYRLVPSRFKEFPVKNSECLDEADNVYGFHPVKWPRVVRAMNKIYVLPDSVDNFHFQWFDPAGNRFHGLPPPPFESSPLYTPASYSPRSPSVPSNEKLSYGSPEYEVDNDSDGVYVDEEDMGVEQEHEHEQFEGSVGEKPPRYEEKGEQDECPEHDPVALARSLASRFEMKGLDKTGDNALSRSFIRTQLKSIMYGLAMIDRADAASEQRIIQEAEHAAVEAKVKALELQLEASNKACSAAKAELEALKHEKIKLRETVKAQRKQLRAKDEELVSTRDKAIQEWRQSEEFRQAARSYAWEDTDRRKKRCRSRD